MIKILIPQSKNAFSLTVLSAGLLLAITACSGEQTPEQAQDSTQSLSTIKNADKPVSDSSIELPHKAVVYQVFTRLYGNTKTVNKPWGTIAENGVGKFSDFTELALKDIKSLGVTHIWYTGVPHHAVINDYTSIGIAIDDPDVVKGRAGSPYAVKDYYNVNPDLADNPANRLTEFESLIARTHQQDMKVIIDIVPNHVARSYQSLSNPFNGPNDHDADFGAKDDTQVEYSKHNNFYYVIDNKNVAHDFAVPKAINGYKPLGGEAHPLADDKFNESPAKWTGNGSRLAQPDANDWYETVKINYGVKPDGSYDFPTLPIEYAQKSAAEHLAFWQSQPEGSIPDSWVKFNEITQYWLAKGVDGFRYDMAEMVPVEFWSYLNSHIKHTNPHAFLLAEVYNPDLYRAFVQQGKMDYLYDKVDLYDTLKDIIRDKASTAEIAVDQQKVADIEAHMLHFLENHDEQRINTTEFAGSAEAALPAMVVSSLISRSPTLLYFGQDVGEQGAENAGFGQPTRTSIFDYIGVPAHQRWMNNGKFDGGQSTESEKKLRQYYQHLLTLSQSQPAFKGEYLELDTLQRALNVSGYDDKTFAFTRFNPSQKLIVVNNFHKIDTKQFTLVIPKELIDKWAVNNGTMVTDLLNKTTNSYTLQLQQDGSGSININLEPLQSLVLEVNPKP